MKQFYSLIAICFFSLNTFSQTDILGEWFLYEFLDDDVIIFNTYNPQMSINFSENSGNYSYSGHGACNDYFGMETISIQENTFEAFPPNWTLAICEYDAEDWLQENIYNKLFLNHLDSQNVTVLDYTITGSGMDAILQIINTTYVPNSLNGYEAVYGRQLLSAPKSILTSIKLKENPVNDEIELIINVALADKITYSIYTLEGKIFLNQKSLSLNTINVDFLQSGIYFLRLQSENWEKVIKFFKQ